MTHNSDKISARERLLKLIDGDPTTMQQAQNKNPLKEFFGNFRERCSLSLENISFGVLDTTHQIKSLLSGTPRREFSLVTPPSKLSNGRRIILIIIALTFTYIVVDLIQLLQFDKKDFIASKEATPAIIQAGPLEYYIDQVRGKDIFNIHRVDTAGKKGGGMPFADGLKLVGVDWGTPPTAMIEDIQNTKTFFVKKGDSIKELKVQEILRDRVIVGFKNQLFELK